MKALASTLCFSLTLGSIAAAQSFQWMYPMDANRAVVINVGASGCENPLTEQITDSGLSRFAESLDMTHDCPDIVASASAMQHSQMYERHLSIHAIASGGAHSPALKFGGASANAESSFRYDFMVGVASTMRLVGQVGATVEHGPVIDQALGGQFAQATFILQDEQNQVVANEHFSAFGVGQSGATAFDHELVLQPGQYTITAHVGAIIADFLFPDGISGEATLDATLEVVGVPGDMNCDESVSVADINPFITALTDPDAYFDQLPFCGRLGGDTNNDGEVTVSDINGFVALLLQS